MDLTCLFFGGFAQIFVSFVFVYAVASVLWFCLVVYNVDIGILSVVNFDVSCRGCRMDTHAMWLKCVQVLHSPILFFVIFTSFDGLEAWRSSSNRGAMT